MSDSRFSLLLSLYYPLPFPPLPPLLPSLSFLRHIRPSCRFAAHLRAFTGLRPHTKRVTCRCAFPRVDKDTMRLGCRMAAAVLVLCVTAEQEPVCDGDGCAEDGRNHIKEKAFFDTYVGRHPVPSPRSCQRHASCHALHPTATLASSLARAFLSLSRSLAERSIRPRQHAA